MFCLSLIDDRPGHGNYNGVAACGYRGLKRGQTFTKKACVIKQVVMNGMTVHDISGPNPVNCLCALADLPG